MDYKQILINTATPDKPKSKVMIIYTGGTFGMAHDAHGVLVPFDFALILEHLPTLRNLSLELTVISFNTPIDSSNIRPEHWQTIATIIFENYKAHDGFVVLHGTDTMAFTASALSFMLSGLAKPVILTGAQLPISEPRSDARENLITSLEIAAAKNDGRAIVPEVCIYFGNELIRGNRSKKTESMHFDAFQSENYPPLAKAGVKIEFNEAAIHQLGEVRGGTNLSSTWKESLSISPGFVYSQTMGELKLLDKLDPSIVILKLFPGITEATVRTVVNIAGLKAIVLETYGSGNAPTTPWFIELLKEAIGMGMILLNISQCPGGMVVQGKYETSKVLQEIGVLSGGDMTTEAALTKLMVLLGEFGTKEAKLQIGKSIAGELSE